MTWIAQRDRHGALFNPGGLDAPHQVRDPATGMPRGTIMVQYDHLVTDHPQNLLRYMARDPVPAALTLRQDPCGRLHVLLRCGVRDAAVVVDLPPLLSGEPVVVRYGWDDLAGVALISVTVVERDIHRVVTMPQSVPLTLGVVQQMAMAPDLGITDEVVFLAVSDTLEPIGPMPGLDPAARVITPDGPRPLGQVRSGDIVLAADGQMAQIRWTGEVTLPALGVFRPILLRAPYYGLHQDLVLNGNQPLVLRGSDVEYLFASSEVRVVVRDLVDNRAALEHPALTVVRYRQVLIDRPVGLLVEGIPVPGFDPGPAIADPDLAAGSVLAGFPAELVPRNLPDPRLPLRSYEAQTLSRMRVA